ncbi:MAG: T9SS type A sorting domain-containing protein [Bacteroidetes bacterium]|nr:T9SS type A sorting domain-containing protein [Bacteroidota bacterium]
MKQLKIKLIIILCLLGFIHGYATKVTVQVANYVFTPASVSVTVGDTIVWNWVNGMHTTTSLTIPATAAAWDAMIDNTATTFEYKITVAGTYNYECTPHSFVGMTGTITAVASGLGIIENTTNNSNIKVYPNPINTLAVLNLNTLVYSGKLSFSLYDILGNKVRTIESVTNDRLVINREGLLSGIYFYQLHDAETIIASGKLLVD